MSAIWETQKAIYSKLTASTPLMAMVEGVFDYVPEGNAFPYITIGDISCDNLPVLGKDNYSLDASINAYSRANGRKELAAVLEKIREVLENQPLTITGYGHVFTRYVSAETIQMGDGKTLAGRVVFGVGVRGE